MQIHSYACEYSCANMVEKTILSLLNGFGTLNENQLTINVKFYFCTLSSVALIYMSVYMSVQSW